MTAQHGLRAAVALTLLASTLLSGCATAPEQAVAQPKQTQAPWTGLARVDFRSLLGSYALANLDAHRDETLDKFLRSQTKTFDRYVAAKEVGVGIDPLKQEAIGDIQAMSAMLPNKVFVLRTNVSVSVYDVQQGGFPIYERPFDLNMSLHLNNDDVRTSVSTDGATRGMSIIAKDYAFSEADLWFSKDGWLIPSAPDKAVRILEILSKTGGDKKISLVIKYSLSRCDASDREPTSLSCRANVRSMYVIDPVRPDDAPIAELTHRG